MDVIYEPSILDKIEAAVSNAGRTGRVIDHINLTGCEWDLMRDETRGLVRLYGICPIRDGQKIAQIHGVTIKVEG